MILPFVLSFFFWLDICGFYTQHIQQETLFKQQPERKPSEFEALNIKWDYGTSPEPQRLSRREKIALKLTQISKNFNKD